MDTLTEKKILSQYPAVVSVIQAEQSAQNAWGDGVKQLITGEFRIAERYRQTEEDKESRKEVLRDVAKTFGLWDTEQDSYIPGTEGARSRLRGLLMDSSDVLKYRDAYKAREGRDIFDNRVPKRDEFGNVVPGAFSDGPISRRQIRARVQPFKTAERMKKTPAYKPTLNIEGTKGPIDNFINGLDSFLAKAEAGTFHRYRAVLSSLAERLNSRLSNLAELFQVSAVESEDMLLGEISKALDTGAHVLDPLREAFHATTDETGKARLRDAIQAHAAELGMDSTDLLKKAVNE